VFLCFSLCLRNLASQELFQKASYSWVGGGCPFRSAPLCSKGHHHVLRALRVVVFLFLFLSTFLPFFFLCLCSNFFGHLLHWPSQPVSWLCSPLTAALWSCDTHSGRYNTLLLLLNVLSLCRPL
jgi:hypothetical protein